MKWKRVAIVGAVVLAMQMTAGVVFGAEGVAEGGTVVMGVFLPLWSGIPFVGMLLSIALFPLIKPRFWHHHYGKVSAFWAVAFSLPFLFIYKSEALHKLLHIVITDYIPFIILLWSLFTIAGGIAIRGTLKGTPITNCILLAIGTGLASFIGTTGAAMLMIRPFLRANKERIYKVHGIIFFIFLVANIGGCLTPLGDPPLFLGFLHGVSFFWTFSLLPETVMVSGYLFILFFVIDSWLYKKEREHATDDQPNGDKGVSNNPKIRFGGVYNLIFLGGVVFGVLLSGFWHPGVVYPLGIAVPIENLVRNILLILMGMLSILVTPRVIRAENEFSWEPIKEVALLFIGIFITIVPVIEILQAGKQGALAGIVALAREPAHYFWLTGLLSSFLDNAPTYLTFFNTALGSLNLHEPEITTALHMNSALWTQHFGTDTAGCLQRFEQILRAISTGAVYMGANTYIGNAPNFMIRSIAEESGIRMPSFFGYILRYSIPILIPAFILSTVIFFL